MAILTAKEAQKLAEEARAAEAGRELARELEARKSRGQIISRLRTILLAHLETISPSISNAAKLGVWRCRLSAQSWENAGLVKPVNDLLDKLAETYPHKGLYSNGLTSHREEMLYGWGLAVPIEGYVFFFGGDLVALSWDADFNKKYPPGEVAYIRIGDAEECIYAGDSHDNS